ncbi:hypothetical protein AB0D12_04475 [Streptomyces sp. NPDC048479]|uniref:hypothetical protein n=1 Tax=Streptomyces sp. NPDC048479 TaxID=3154725 RepID=UPI00341E1B96
MINSPHKHTPSSRRTPRRLTWICPLLVVMGVLASIAAAGVLALTWLFAEVDADLTKQEYECCWPEGATFAWTSNLMGARIPEEAADRRAGYKVGMRYDSGLLSFTLPSPQAEKYLAALTRPGTVTIANLHPEDKGYKPAAGFGHLGLPEPETIVEGTRLGGLCSGDVKTPEAMNVHYCIELFAHQVKPGTTRFYMRSTIEPSVSPPPAPSKT